MITGTLVHQHTVIAFRNPHNVVAACRHQKRCQVFNIVLVRLHMVGIACVAAHRNTGQFTHKMVFQTCAGNLFGVVEIFRSDEANHRIHQERIVFLCKSIASCFHGYLVPAVMSFGRKFRTLSCLEIHNVGACAGGFSHHQIMGLVQHSCGQTKGFISLLRTCDRLEHQINGRMHFTNSLHLGGHMGQYANLGRNFPFIFKFIKTL